MNILKAPVLGLCCGLCFYPNLKGQAEQTIEPQAALHAKQPETMDLKIEQTFKDVCLQTAIKKMVKENPELQDLSTIQMLQLDHIKIKDLQGIEKLSHVKDVSLVGNYIIDITPLAGLAEIRSLNLSNNQISHPSALNRLRYLTQLNLSSNDIKYTFGCVYQNLRELDLSENKIDQLIGTKGTNLLIETLDVSNNPLQAVVSFALPSLKRFKANHTFLSQVNDLWECQKLEAIELKSCPHMKTLDGFFSKNKITGVYECKFPNLKELTFSEDFLSLQAREMLKEIYSGNINQEITINGNTVCPKRPQAAPQPRI